LKEIFSEAIILAKNGTMRGGARLNSGLGKKPLHQKLLEGNPGKRKLEVMEFENAVELQGQEMPKPRKFLSELQKD
jgi:hypothetical protein